MRKALDTKDASGVVRMISSAGRIVCAVVWAAPDTMPSTCPDCTSIVPKYVASSIVSYACSSGDSLVLAHGGVLLCELLPQGRLGRIHERHPGQVDAGGDRLGLDLRGPAQQDDVDDSRMHELLGGAQDPLVGALRAGRSGVGRERARSSRSNVNISGVTTSGWDSRMFDGELLDVDAGVELAEGRRDLATTRRADLAAQGLQRVRAWRRCRARRRRPACRTPSSSDRVIGSGRWPQVSRTPAGVGMSRLRADAAVPTARSARSPDATTSAPSERIGSRVCRWPEPAT